MDYAHANGIPELRKNIAALYPGAGPENVLVTVGAIEANYDILWGVLSAGDEVVVMLPNYMQIWGLAKNLNLNLKTFSLDEKNGWAPDLDGLKKAVTGKTKLIAVCNPNNPTGYILKNEEMEAIIETARRVRGLDPGGRGVRRGRALGRRADAFVLRKVRKSPGRRQPEQGVRPAGAPDRLGRRPGRRRRRDLGEARISDLERHHALEPPGRVRPVPPRPAPPHPARPRLYPPRLTPSWKNG